MDKRSILIIGCVVVLLGVAVFLNARKQEDFETIQGSSYLYNLPPQIEANYEDLTQNADFGYGPGLYGSGRSPSEW